MARKKFQWRSGEQSSGILETMSPSAAQGVLGLVEDKNRNDALLVDFGGRIQGESIEAN